MTESIRKITVIGRAEMFIPVDTVTLDLGLCRSSSNQNECLKNVTDEANNIIKSIIDIGISKDCIKMKNPIVRFTTKKISRTDNRVTEETVIKDGVEAELHIAVNIPLTSFASVYGKICLDNISISTSFSNSSYDEYRSELLKMVGNDAYKKAEALADSVGAKIGYIIEISFTGGYHGAVRSTRMMCCDSNSNPCIEADPEDIHISEEAEFVWALI